MKVLNNVKVEEKELIKYRLKGIEPVLVVAGLIEKDGKYLIAQRLKGNSSVVGRWEFPGGKVKIGELESDAIEREIKEEFNLSIKARKYLASVIYEYPDRTVYLKLWDAIVSDDGFEMDKLDHKDFAWVSLEEIDNYDLCPADRELYGKIKS